MKSLFFFWSTICALLLSISLFAQLPGDECNTAIPYPGDVLDGVCVTGFDFSSFSDNGISSPLPTGDFGGDATVWFSWKAPITTAAGEPLHLNFDAGNYGIGIEFYNTDCFTPATNCLANVSGKVVGLTQGTNYLMLVWDDGVGETNCDFCLSAAPPPPTNDECAGATPYPGDVVNGTCVTGFDFTLYTNSGISPFISCTPVGPNSAWFSWTAPVQTNVGDPITLQFDNGQNQTNNCQLSLEFFSTDCLTPLSNCLFVSSGQIVGLTQGTDYIMLVENPPFGNTTCDFCLSIAPPPPPNDECTGAIPYPGDVVNGICVSGYDFSQFTDSGISPSPYCDGGDATAWFTFTVPVNTVAGDFITLQWDAGLNCGIGVNVFELDCLSPVSTCLNNNNGFLPGLVQGNNYLLNLWDDGSGDVSCDFCLTIPPPPSPGDECSDPIPYPGDIANGTCVTGFDFTNFSNTGISPNPNCAFTQQTVWFTITTPVTSNIGDPINLLFDGVNCFLGTQFFSVDCQNFVSTCVSSNGIISGLLQGNDYLMALGNSSGINSCDFCLTIGPPPPPNDECTGAMPYPGDVLNGICVTGFDFSPYTDAGILSPIATCDFGNDAAAWFSWTAPVTSAAGDPLYLNFDDGSGLNSFCGIGIEFYETDCLTPAGNCLANQSGFITGLIQGTDYLMLVWDDGSGDFSCDFCLNIAPTPPPGDECFDPLPYPGDIVNSSCVTNFDFSSYTENGISPSLFCAPALQNVWFTVTTPVTTIVGDPINLLFDGSYCSLSTQFYSLDCSFSVSNCITNSGIVTGLLQGTDYLMIVNNSYGSSDCDFCLTLPPPPPPNDECVGAIPYPGDVVNEICVTGYDFIPHTNSSSSPTISCGPIGLGSAWFSWTAPVTTSVGDPLSLIFDGGSCSLSIEIFSADCYSSIGTCIFGGSGSLNNLIQGTDYLILVDNFFGGTQCDFCLTFPPPNDECITAIPYPGDVLNGVCVTNFNFAPFTDTGIQSPIATCDFGNDAAAWFSWTAPITTAPGELINLIFDDGTGLSSNCGIGIEFYSTDCLTPVGNCLANQSGFITGLTQGTDYLMLIWDDGSGASGCDFCLTVAPPTNTPDNLCDAYALTLGEDCSTTFPFSNLGASAQVGEPIPDCYTEGSIEASVWFSFVAPPSGVVSISTDFSGSEIQDTQLALFELPTGDCSDLFTLNEIACNEDAMPFAANTLYNAALPPLALTPGQIYFIQVDSYDDGYGYTNQGSFCIVVSDSNPPPNDECVNADSYGGFGFQCTKIFDGTTFGASANGSADIFSCDNQEYNASVYYSFLTNDSEVEFNLLTGFNVNVTLFTTGCENGGVEVSGNCFTNINSSSDPNVLFTNLIPGTGYVMAIWTNEMEETDFSFCLTRPSYVCGDSYCYDLAESYSNCPGDCPCESDMFFFNYYSGFSSSFTAYGVCPEIIGATTDPANPGLYIPFFLNTNDLTLTGSTISTTYGTLYNNSIPPIPLPNNQATNFFMYVFLTEAEIAAGGINTITFSSDNGACFEELIFDINDLNYTSPSTNECGNCNLLVEPDYDNAFCSGGFVSLDIYVQNSYSYNICISQDGNLTCDPGVDIFLSPYYPVNITFPNNDITLTVIDESMPNCAYRTTFYAGDFACSGSAACIDYYDTPTTCRLEPEILEGDAICNGDGTLSIPLDLGRPTGFVSFNPGNDISGSGTDSDPYTINVDLNNCAPIDLTIMDESTCDETPIVTVNSPPSIAGGITVSTNSADWGVQIPYELGICGSGAAVEGNVVTVNDGNTSGGQLTDFCEPTPPIPPDPSVCNDLSGNIVLIDRGQCNFTQKVENAQNCGAIGVVICNCEPGPGWCAATADVLITMAAGTLNTTINIPAVFMLYQDCERIKMELNNGNDVNLCIGAPETLAGCSRDLTVDVCNEYECPTGEAINPSTCECELDTGDCEEEIMGGITTPDEGCDVSGIEIAIVAPDGSTVTVTTDASGNFTVPGGPYPCGIYSATIITPPMDLPDCYSATGTIGPIQFEVDGEGNGNDGPYFIANPEVPTLSQWGLIILALLMMSFGAISIGGQIFYRKQGAFL